jgi:hypothetical protein
MCKCLGKTFLTVLTLSTIGVVTLVVTALFVVVRVKHLYLVDDAVNTGIIIAFAASCVIFVLAIAGSCCGGKCLRTFLAIIYILFAAALVVIGVLFATNRNKIVPELAKFWTDPDSKTATVIQEAFHCTCFNFSNETCLSGEQPPASANDTCSAKIQEAIDLTWEWVLSLLVSVAGLLVLAAILALVCAYCCNREPSGHGGIEYRAHYGALK